jgi:hypothetical protein
MSFWQTNFERPVECRVTGEQFRDFAWAPVPNANANY